MMVLVQRPSPLSFLAAEHELSVSLPLKVGYGVFLQPNCLHGVFSMLSHFLTSLGLVFL